MSTGSPATRALALSRVTFRLLDYDYIPGHDRIGLNAAGAIGVARGCVLKALMVEVDGRPACAVMPSDRTLSMKRVATAFGGSVCADDGARGGGTSHRLP